jgi:hypothetical protein
LDSSARVSQTIFIHSNRYSLRRNWALWHVPIIIFAGYNVGTGWYGLAVVSANMIGLCFILTWLRLKSGSLWTGVILHASSNHFIQQFFDPMIMYTGSAKYILGEFGIGFTLVVAMLAAYFLDAPRGSGPILSRLLGIPTSQRCPVISPTENSRRKSARESCTWRNSTKRRRACAGQLLNEGGFVESAQSELRNRSEFL